MIIEAIDMALKNIDPRYCELSKIIYPKISVYKYLAEQKWLERPFAYEFYHQFRKLLDVGRFDFGGSVIQAEVDKRYQRITDLGKIPDFILHTPNSNEKNLSVIEFKLASNYGKPLEDDLKKLVTFRRGELNYKYLVEVIIGNNENLKIAWNRIDSLKTADGEKIWIIGYDVDTRDTDIRCILYEPTRAI